MKPTKYSQASVQTLLKKLDPKAVFSALGVEKGRIQETEDAYRTNCPFHINKSNYSLVTERDTYSTYCLDLGCRESRLNEGGGNIIEFYALAKNTSYDAALEEWSERLNVTLDVASEVEVQVERDASYFKYVEVARLVYSETEEGEVVVKPGHIVAGGEEGLGRGLIVPVAELKSLSQQYSSDLYRSHFAYELTDKEAIDEEHARGSLFLLGDYYIVFEAKTSAEIVHAINQAIELVERMNKDFGIPFEAINIYYSHKIIEVEVDYPVFGASPRVDLDRIFAEMTRILISREEEPVVPGPFGGFGQVNLEVYKYDYLTPIPGTRITVEGKELYKIRLPYNLFKKTSYQRLHELSRRRPELGDREPVQQISQAGRNLYERAKRAVEGEGKEDEHETIATLFYRDTETPGPLTTADQLAKTLLKRLFSENRLILRTPSEHLNRALGGGFYPGNLYMVAGFPGTGITTFSIWLLLKIAEAHEIPCVFLSLQVGIEEVFKRAMAMLGDIDLAEISQKRLRPGELYSDSQFHRRAFSAYERFQQITNNVIIIEGAAVANVEHLRKLIAELKRQTVETNGSSNVFLVIDSLQLMLAHVRASRENEERVDLEMLTSMLKWMARELDITIYATAEYYTEHHSFYAGIDPANPELKELYQNTQFADTVAVFTGLGARLHNLIDYYRSTLATGPDETQSERMAERLREIEARLTATEQAREKRSAFAVLDIIKNRGGMTSKVLFIYNRNTATFEPVEYCEAANGA